jgi:Ca-activated chloride channel homolog
VDLDEETLKKVAQIGGGKYFRAADSHELAEVYDVIDRAEKTEVKVKEFFHFRELYPYFLIPALLLLGMEIVVRATVLRVIP